MKTIRIQTASMRGIEPVPVDVIVKVYKDRFASGRLEFPGTTEARAREARVRALAAATSITPLCTNANVTVEYRDPQGKPLEHEPAFDLAVGIALLKAWNYPGVTIFKSVRYIGELALDGTLRPVRGALVRASGAPAVLPTDNGPEMSVEKTRWTRIFVNSLADALGPAARPPRSASIPPAVCEEPMKLLRGDGSVHDGEALIDQAMLAMARGENVLLLGRPGSGKMMVARRIASRLERDRPLSAEERLELAKIQSVAGLCNGAISRPFRAPHHTVSEAGLAGTNNRPGEASLAHSGVLLLDELEEFRDSALSALANALNFQRNFPAKPALVVGSASPCPCGQYVRAACRCSPEARKRRIERVTFRAQQFNMHIINMDETYV